MDERRRSDVRPPGTDDLPLRPRGPEDSQSFAGEDSTYTLGVETMGGIVPPDGQAELIEYIADFAPTELMNALRCAEPLAEVHPAILLRAADTVRPRAFRSRHRSVVPTLVALPGPSRSQRD